MKLISFAILLFFTYGLTASSLHVGAGQPYSTIREALEKAKNGDTLFVHEGIYAEGNLAVDKSLILIGLNYPVLDGQHRDEIITVTASNVTIRGFEIRNGGQLSTLDVAGIKVLSANNVVVEDNRLRDCNFAIYLSNTIGCRVCCNDIQGIPKEEQNSGNGVHLWKCSEAIIEDNYITGQRDGIYFEFVTDSEIRGNTSEQNIRYGLHFMFSHNDQYHHNTFRNNGAGVAVMYSRQVKMYENRFSYNWGGAAYGILLKDISDSHIWKNTFEHNSAGVYMEGASRIVLEENEFRENGWALRVQASCDANVVRRNNFFGNSFDVATNGHLVLNTFDGNYWDKYEGYDLNRDGVGDVPYRPVNLYAIVVERMPYGLVLMRSFMVYLLDKAEKIIPSLTPEQLKDEKPAMRPL
ncbi:MAG: nitrous oxide reductase family maturation protein NosD [Haliscomenobacteraceae bacterium CHB4]|nr:putative ABC transporter binding protein NosD [Saprospiraceae bacterium]MCE7923656.1 nitrous oxide reductase family maturation protein NosD [Haliscomenobacteraceae bacterium CHB4]